MATIQLGKIKQVWRGTWSSSPNPAYSVDDLVEYTDSGVTSTYIAVSTPGSQVPSSSGTVQSNWNLVAKGVADPIPSQSGNAGKALITDGSSVSWGDGGAWTKIAGGSGPSTSVDGITIDNIFSDSYKYYKIFYSYAAGYTMYFRYVKADGTTQSSGNYQHSIHGANQTVGGSIEHNVWGYNGQTKGVYHWWDATSTKPAYVEINLYHPYASSIVLWIFTSVFGITAVKLEVNQVLTYILQPNLIEVYIFIMEEVEVK
jgi:hypothetical protein